MQQGNKHPLHFLQDVLEKGWARRQANPRATSDDEQNHPRAVRGRNPRWKKTDATCLKTQRGTHRARRILFPEKGVQAEAGAIQARPQNENRYPVENRKHNARAPARARCEIHRRNGSRYLQCGLRVARAEDSNRMQHGMARNQKYQKQRLGKREDTRKNRLESHNQQMPPLRFFTLLKERMPNLQESVRNNGQTRKARDILQPCLPGQGIP